jgi:Xaa-Pro aminopeptidase
MDHAAQRRERLARVLPREGTDALVLSNPVSVTYLTGFTGDSTVLVLTRDRALLVSDPRYTGQLAAECPGLATHIRPPTQKLPEAVVEVLRKLGVRSVGFESAAVTVAEYEVLRGLAPTLDWKGSADRVEGLRMVKDAWEVEQIRAAISIGERAFTVFRALLRPDDREKDLADALEGYVRRLGGRGTCFTPIIEVGERAALPHAHLTDRAVATGCLLLVDWGVTGPYLYKSDLTRVLDTRTTSPFPAGMGEKGPTLEGVHAVVRRAQEAAIRAVRPGIAGQAVDAAARAVIAEGGYGDYFTHGTGHGIGLEVHEAPALRPLSETVLEPGMVFTIEPGIYLPGWGGVRIEDDVLVTPEGCEVLSHVPRDLESLRAFA